MTLNVKCFVVPLKLEIGQFQVNGEVMVVRLTYLVGPETPVKLGEPPEFSRQQPLNDRWKQWKGTKGQTTASPLKGPDGSPRPRQHRSTGALLT